jgi:Protein of unknown function (DUF3618)
MGEDPRALRREVEDARAQLGDTVEALAYKASAPKRAARSVREQARARVTPAVVGAVVASGAVVLTVLVLRRRGLA